MGPAIYSPLAEPPSFWALFNWRSWKFLATVLYGTDGDAVLKLVVKICTIPIPPRKFYH